MPQHDYSLANQDTASYRGDLNSSILASVSLNSGGTAPATTYAYQLWADTLTGFLKIRNAANTNWITVGSLSATSLGLVALATTSQQMTGALELDAFEDIASSGTTAIGGTTSNLVRITGGTTITSFGTIAAGVWRIIRFETALTLTHNGTSLILPTSANIQTTANDAALAISLGAGNWIVIMFQKASGSLLSNSSQVTLVTTTTHSLVNADYGQKFVYAPTSNCQISIALPSSLSQGWFVDVWAMTGSYALFTASKVAGFPADYATQIEMRQFDGQAQYSRISLVGSLFDFQPRQAFHEVLPPTAGISAEAFRFLGAKHRRVYAQLECQSANNGYVVGERLVTAVHPQQANASASFGMSIVSSRDTFLVKIGANGLLLNDKSTGGAVALTEAQWKLILFFAA